MIRLSYALKLARTKLRSRRGMLIASTLLASLLFSLLITTIIVFTGAEKSANEFIKKAGNDRYLVLASPNIPFEDVDFTNPPSLEDIREIKAFEIKYYQALRDKYESLGIEYDDSTEVSSLLPDATAPETLPEEQRVRLNWMSPVLDQMREDKFKSYAEDATNKVTDLKALGDSYGASGYYLAGKQSGLPQIPGLRLIEDGKENFGVSDLKSGDSTTYGYYINAIHNSMYSFTDRELLGRYLLIKEEQDLEGVPVIVSAQEAARLFGDQMGIGEEPQSAGDKKTWLNEVQTKLNGHVYEVCYRNPPEQLLLEKIQRDYAEIKINEGVQDFQKPSLIYDYPTEACGDILVKQDVRTSLERQADVENQELQRMLGTYVAPAHRLVKFQIVGIKYAQSFTDYSRSVDGYIKSLLVSQESSSSSLDIPIQLYNTLPEELKIDDIRKENNGRILRYAASDDDFTPRILEFSTVDDARRFLGQACATDEYNCAKKFYASPYGSNYLILDEINKLFSRIAGIAFPVVFGLAAIIVWLTISRIMAENRRETAIYRAMGAKRHDVTIIYLVYVFIVALQIAIGSIVLGLTVAFVIDYFYGGVLTDTAGTVFGVIDGAPEFSLFSLESPLLIIVAVSIFVICIIASALPLSRNVRRSPISDMRDE